MTKTKTPMTKTNKLKCPDCGVEMNHHAEKIDYTSGLDEPEAIDADFGGIPEEVHSCPQCGKALTRREGAASEVRN
jgi:predicted RNA-binding Zn-ribbon protein involved in translation (DUF1610 family)